MDYIDRLRPQTSSGICSRVSDLHRVPGFVTDLYRFGYSIHRSLCRMVTNKNQLHDKTLSLTRFDRK